MNSVFNLPNNIWTLFFSALGCLAGLCFNFYSTGNYAFGYGIFGIPVGGIIGAVIDKNRTKLLTMLFLFAFILSIEWLK